MSLLITSPDLSAIPAARSEGRRKYVSADGIVFDERRSGAGSRRPNGACGTWPRIYGILHALYCKGMTITVPTALFLGFIILQRLGELVIAKRNTAALMARCAHEVGAGHYPVIAAIHSARVLALVVFGRSQPVHLGCLALYALLQVFRIWILGTLDRRWTTRVIVFEGEILVARGPFRYFRHPNYILVVAEIIVAPMVLGLWCVAVVWTVLNALMLGHRIRVEDNALRG